jgi:LytS/YehU family sensor histidine kinase
MNSIQKYILENDSDSAVLFLGEFSKLIRKNLDHCTRPYISIHEEIEYLNSYIYIENKRFNNSVMVELTVDEAIDTYFMEIPSMIIQPFIENVFVHAFPQVVIAPKLNIDFSLVQENILVCKIMDNGVGISTPSKKIHKSKGILLIKERFKLLGYDVNESLRITSSKNKGTCVIISLKL